MADKGSVTEGTADNAAPGGTTDGAGDGAAATAAKPQRAFVDGHWMTMEELASQNSQLSRENAEQKGRLEAAPVANQTQQQAPGGPEPEWANVMREEGTAEATIQQLVARDSAQQSVNTRAVVMDELNKIGEQARQLQVTQESAKTEFRKAASDFNEADMHVFLGNDPVAKEGYDALNASGKHYQALDFAWSKRLLSRSTPVSEQGRQHARVPAGAGTPRVREESTRVAGQRPKIPEEILENVSYNADEEAIKAYMRFRREGTALDLDAEPPVNLSRR